MQAWRWARTAGGRARGSVAQWKMRFTRSAGEGGEGVGIPVPPRDAASPPEGGSGERHGVGKIRLIKTCGKGQRQVKKESFGERKSTKKI